MMIVVLEMIVDESGGRPADAGWLRFLVLPRERYEKGLRNKKRARAV